MTVGKLPGDPNPDKLSNAISWWLGSEVKNADSGQNSYLSEFRKRRIDFFMPFDLDQNLSGQKAIAHHSRLINWLDSYRNPDHLTDDWAASKLIFASLMKMSGSYRLQCLLQASSASDYELLRKNHAGIDISQAIQAEMASDGFATLVSANPEDRVENITERTLVANDRSLVLLRSINDWAIDKYIDSDEPLGSQGNEPIDAMLESQSIWAGLTVAHIAVAASFRNDDYSKVPFLEPKSITDVSQQVIYPLAS